MVVRVPGHEFGLEAFRSVALSLYRATIDGANGDDINTRTRPTSKGSGSQAAPLTFAPTPRAFARGRFPARVIHKRSRESREVRVKHVSRLYVAKKCA